MDRFINAAKNNRIAIKKLFRYVYCIYILKISIKCVLAQSKFMTTSETYPFPCNNKDRVDNKEGVIRKTFVSVRTL